MCKNTSTTENFNFCWWQKWDKDNPALVFLIKYAMRRSKECKKKIYLREILGEKDRHEVAEEIQMELSGAKTVKGNSRDTMLQLISSTIS